MIDTNINKRRDKIDPQVWMQARIAAIKEHTTITKIIERALVEFCKNLEAQSEK